MGILLLFAVCIGITIFVTTMFAMGQINYYKGRLKAEQAKYPHPVAFHTVDMALVKEDGKIWQVAMGQKPYEVTSGLWRFPGGFVDPVLDDSAEAAAIRELNEEMIGNCIIGDPRYLMSMRTNDPRYRDRVDKIITTLFFIPYRHGDIKAGDDLAACSWIDVDVKSLDQINPIHKKLFEVLIRHKQDIEKQRDIAELDAAHDGN
jgi:ADP-ribose pyrophosphatase YjhB (NUDIX family)